MDQERNKLPLDDAGVGPVVAYLAKIGRNKSARRSAGAYEPEHSMEKVFLFLMSSSCFVLAVSLSFALLFLMEDRATSLMI